MSLETAEKIIKEIEHQEALNNIGNDISDQIAEFIGEGVRVEGSLRKEPELSLFLQEQAG